MPHTQREELLRSAYEAFNARDIDSALAAMTPDVDWANGWEGGRVVGHDAVATTGNASGPRLSRPPSRLPSPSALTAKSRSRSTSSLATRRGPCSPTRKAATSTTSAEISYNA